MAARATSISWLVTGAGGFIGARILARLAGAGARVIGVHRGRLAPELKALARADHCRFVQADLARPLELSEAPDVVVHMAGRIPRAGVSAADLVRDNVLATQNVVDYAVGSKASMLVYFSSVSVYGEVRVPVVDESTARINADPYGVTKYLGERCLREAEGALPSLSLRLPGVVGPGAKLPWLARIRALAAADSEITVVNPTAPFNNVVDIDDLYRFITGVVERPPSGADVVTLGAARPMAIEEVARLVVRSSGSSSPIRKGRGGKCAFTLSNERAMTRYGYQPKSVEALVRAFVAESA